MSFLNNTHLLLMDTAALGQVMGYDMIPLSLDDLKRLKDCGAGAVLEPLLWDFTEPARGIYDWRLSDEAVDRCRRAGLKVLLTGPNSVPQWCPRNWYVQDANGTSVKAVDPRSPVTIWGALSPWCGDAQAYQDDFIRLVCKRYNSDDILCIQSHSRDGEAVLPPGVAAFYDPAAVASYRMFAGDRNAMPDPSSDVTQKWIEFSVSDLLVRQARLYVETTPYREYWSMLHPYYRSRTYGAHQAGWSFSGNGQIFPYLERIQREVKPDSMMHLLFTVFQNGHDSFVFDFISALQGMGIGVVSGSEWSKGLILNTPDAIRLGLRGTLTAPCHPYLRKAKVEEWEFDAFKSARELWRRAEAVTV